MTTVRLKNSVFMHVPKTGCTTATLAFHKTKSITYDYRYKLCPGDDVEYDENCKMYVEENPIPHPPDSMPHANICELRDCDRDLQKIIIVRNPLDWYVSYWLHHKRFDWSTEINPPYLEKGGDRKFSYWIENMSEHSDKIGHGFFTRYVGDWVDNKTHFVRLENIVEDMRFVLRLCGENEESADHMESKCNARVSSRKFEIPDYIKHDIRHFDSKIFGLYHGF